MNRYCFIILAAFLQLVSAGEKDIRIKIAVNDLTGRGISQEEAAILSDRLRAELVNTSTFRVMERAEMVSILKEQGFQTSGACDEASCLVEVGQLLGVEDIVAGSVGKISDLYSVSLRFINIQTGEILFTISEDREGNLKEILTDVIPTSARKMALQISGKPLDKEETVELTKRSENHQTIDNSLKEEPVVKLNLVPRKTDHHTIAIFTFDSVEKGPTGNKENFTCILNGASLVDGFKGKAIKCSHGAYAELGSIIQDKTAEGTVEFFLQPSSMFNPNFIYSLFGNRGARAHFLYKEGTLYFQKNQDNKHIFVNASVVFKPLQWYKISGTWGPKGLRLFVNDELVAQKQDFSDYQLDKRDIEKFGTFYVGYKEWCCMDGIGIYDRSKSYYFEGLIDELHISNIDRY